MRLTHRFTMVASAGLLALAAAVPAAAGTPSPCAGDGFVYPVSAPEVRTAAGSTFVEFDFAGMHPICLADGTQDVAPVSGHLWQRIGADGSVVLRFVETLTYGGGQLAYVGNATLNGAGWTSHVRTVGRGSGTLAGVHGQGWFSPIDPVTGAFSDEIFYVYP